MDTETATPPFSQTPSRKPLHILKKVKEKLRYVLEDSTITAKLVLTLPGLKIFQWDVKYS